MVSALAVASPVDSYKGATMKASFGSNVLVKRNRRKIVPTALMLACAAVAAIGKPVLALADDWGCQVMLCLADPRGPETESQCVPPIEKLWSELRKGHAFPTCDFASSYNDLPANLQSAIPASVMQTMAASNSGGTNTFASGSYCREDMLYWGGPEQSVLMCRATGAINITINGQLWNRVWWDVSGQGNSIVENYGSYGTQTTPYDPTKAAEEFLELQNGESVAGSSGSRH
jgi:hypothetical protein